MTQPISIRLPEELVTRLKVVSKATDRKPAYFIQKALEKYLEDDFDYQVAIDRLLDKNDEILGFDETKKELGIKM